MYDDCKMKNKAKVAVCQYNLDSGNLMPIKMFKVHFPSTTVADFYNCIDKK